MQCVCVWVIGSNGLYFRWVQNPIRFWYNLLSGVKLTDGDRFRARVRVSIRVSVTVSVKVSVRARARVRVRDNYV